MLMRSVLTYFGPNGEKLEELPLVDVETGQLATPEQMKTLPENEPAVVYLGVFVIGAAIADAQGQVIGVRPQDIRFPIEATSRKEAFEKFEAAATSALEHLKKEQEAKQAQQNQSRLIVPNAAQSEAINKLKLVTE